MYLSNEQLDQTKRAIIKAAKTYIAPRFRELQSEDIRDIEGKGLVTIADDEAERYLTAALTKIVPGSTVIGEEATGKISDNLEKVEKLRNAGGWVWTVDPIDGTVNFVNGNSGFACMIAAVYDGVTQHAWMYFPAKQELMLMATRGKGALVKQHRKQYQIIKWGTPFDKLEFGFYAADTCYRKDEKIMQALKDAVIPCVSGEYDLISIADFTREMIQTGKVGIVHPRLIVWDRTPPALIARVKPVASPDQSISPMSSPLQL